LTANSAFLNSPEGVSIRRQLNTAGRIKLWLQSLLFKSGLGATDSRLAAFSRAATILRI